MWQLPSSMVCHQRPSSRIRPSKLEAFLLISCSSLSKSAQIPEASTTKCRGSPTAEPTGGRSSAGCCPHIMGPSPGSGTSTPGSSGRGERRPKHCYICKEPGHFARSCPRQNQLNRVEQQLGQLHAAFTQMQLSHGASTSGTGFWENPQPPAPPGNPTSLSLRVLPPNSRSSVPCEWIVDSGASIHLVGDLSVLHNPVMHPKPIPLHLATATGQGAIVATGSVCLQNSEGQWVWISNVHYAPGTTVNLLSVSAAVRDGMLFKGDHCGAPTSVVGPGGWSCPVREERGLYFLKWVHMLPSPVPIVGKASVQHTCSRSKLWHNRLGHPGQVNSQTPGQRKPRVWLGHIAHSLSPVQLSLLSMSARKIQSPSLWSQLQTSYPCPGAYPY